MALLHRSEIRPSKIEIITDWARARPWFAGDAEADLEKVAAFRFDDPEGRVGIETLLVRVGDGPILQVPLTYHDAPLEGADEWLLGTMEHSVLGTRFVYDAVGDPVYLRALAAVALEGGPQAEEFYEHEGERTFRDPSAVVTGSGASGSAPVAESSHGTVATRDEGSVTTAVVGILRVALARVPGAGAGVEALARATGAATEREVLTGSWPALGVPVTLAVVARG